MPTRRHILGAMAALPLAGLSFPTLSWSAPAGDARFMVLILRGAMDGLAAVPPLADPGLARLRAPLVPGRPGSEGGALDLDGSFALHPALGSLHALYRQGDLAVIHACASPYRERSHFSGQDALENGTATEAGAHDGWLGRALGPGRPVDGDRAVALGETVPLILQGGSGVTSWSPSILPQADTDTLQRIARLYERDPQLSAALSAALEANQVASADGDGKARPGAGPAARFISLMQAAGRFMATPGGPRVAVADLGGWDTHAGQNGKLGRQFDMLGAGIDALRKSLGEAWRSTAVLVVTEFGRTAAVNGTAGTDHGTAGVAFLLGGAVAGGRVIADWPGLAAGQLHEGRDLRPTIDLRAVAKGVLSHHMKITRATLDEVVFPGSGSVSPLPDLVRT
ncbi:MAG: DUF1501 domain-containing protein [Alphaproteobacteria bacterium]|nr:DUF1501 domain-containing protein [Alphaproteobacteria bacterium]